MIRILLSTTLLLIIFSCGKTSTYRTIQGFAEGTTYKIIYDDQLKRDLTSELDSFFARFDKSLSIYNPESLISRLNTGDSVLRLDDWFIECFNLSQEISRKTDGLLDPTLRPLIAAYGFGGKEGLREVSDHIVDSMLSFTGYESVSITNDRLLHRRDYRTEIDFNAIAKGYSVDLLGRMMDSLEIKNYLIEVGGEIFCKGLNKKGLEWNVAIDTPFEGNYMPGASTQAIIGISNRGMATSGNYRKYFVNEAGEKVVHTIDPRTGRPSIHNLLSATIIAPSCGEADGFATACMVAGLEGAKKIIAKNSQLEALLIYAEGDEMKTYATAEMGKRIKK